MITNCGTGEIVFSSLIPREANKKIIGLAREKAQGPASQLMRGRRFITNNGQLLLMAHNRNQGSTICLERMEQYMDFAVPKFLMLEDGGLYLTGGAQGEGSYGRIFLCIFFLD